MTTTSQAYSVGTLNRVREQNRRSSREHCNRYASFANIHLPISDQTDKEYIDIAQVQFWTDLCEQQGYDFLMPSVY
ncbi:hypothetical protein F442_10270 [Phytophthora nicotianae P10297]|uniref:Uncharacterized protein n=1 Tax=Phytophthora nicotianae P10297 TaxID=1317064 RepID=W2Z651_PHYNI|nr:hypothetical protein F442_10270 [Phytophthora nicotianae P10297]